MKQSVPKRRHIKFRQITQKKEYNEIYFVHRMYLRVLCDSHRAMIMSLNSIEWLLFVPDKHFTVCEGWTEF